MSIWIDFRGFSFSYLCLGSSEELCLTSSGDWCMFWILHSPFKILNLMKTCYLISIDKVWSASHSWCQSISLEILSPHTRSGGALNLALQNFQNKFEIHYQFGWHMSKLR